MKRLKLSRNKTLNSHIKGVWEVKTEAPTIITTSTASLLPQKKLSNTPLSNKTIKRSKKTAKKEIVKKENHENRIHRAYGIIESTLNETSLIVEEDFKTIVKKDKDDSNLDNNSLESSRRIYKVKSSMDKEKNYLVNLEEQSCTCNDFIYRHVKCKHIIAAEFIST